MTFPVDTIVQGSEYRYAPTDGIINNVDYSIWFYDYGVTYSQLLNNAKLTITISDTECTNYSDPTTQETVRLRLNTALAGQIIKHESTFTSNTEEIQIISVVNWDAGVSNLNPSNFVNPNGGRFPDRIFFKVNRAYNGTTLGNDISFNSQSTLYVQPTNTTYTEILNDGVKPGNSLSYSGSFTEVLSQGLGVSISELNFNNVKLFVEENIIFTDVLQDFTVREFLVMINDLIVLSNTSSNKVEYINLIYDLIKVFDQSNLLDFVDYYANVQEFLQMKISNSVLDTIGQVLTVIVNDYFRMVGENGSAFLEYFSRSVEFIKTSQSLGISGDILIQVSDSFRLSDSMYSKIDITVILEEIIKSTFIIEIDGEQYECYALNLDNKALTRYTNYNFNSFAHFNNKYYALGKDGLYDLIYLGEDGEEIESKIKTSFLNISDNGINVLGGLGSLQKSLKTGYFLIKNDGQVGLRVYTDLGNKFDYILKQDYNDNKFRATFGSAVKGSMFQLELTVFNDFELEQCEFIPIIHSKKV